MAIEDEVAKLRRRFNELRYKLARTEIGLTEDELHELIELQRRMVDLVLGPDLSPDEFMEEPELVGSSPRGGRLS
jgi:hypothetical protein